MPAPAPSRPLPPGSLRLFAHYAPEELLPERAAEFLIGRLLEEGDSDDLRWLTGIFSRSQLADWLELRGRRQLTRRSRRFWEIVLGRRSRVDPSPGGEIWPP